VAGGHRQKDGIDVRETFAPTALAVSRRCLLSYGAAMDYEIHQADIKTAFLHGDLEEEAYMEQPPGYGNGDKNMVWRLLKSLYGLKQAPRCWWIKVAAVLRKLGFEPCKSDLGIYINLSDPNNPVYQGVFVHDLKILAKSVEQIEQLKAELIKLFEIHDLGEIN
jgi:hypothetical protein